MGKLTVILGCMFAQKTTELLRYIRRYRSIGQSVLVINSHHDVRYGTGKIISHDHDNYEEALITESMSELDEEIRSGAYDVIAIDEGQFFPDLYDYVSRWADECPVHIIVAGLDGTFQRTPFGHMLCLIPHAEEVLRLSALCIRCGDGTKAIYSKRIVTDQGQGEEERQKATETEVHITVEKVETVVQVGSSESYQPVCRRHYLESE